MATAMGSLARAKPQDRAEQHCEDDFQSLDGKSEAS
jgi:hypothetical protein